MVKRLNQSCARELVNVALPRHIVMVFFAVNVRRGIALFVDPEMFDVDAIVW